MEKLEEVVMVVVVLALIGCRFGRPHER